MDLTSTNQRGESLRLKTAPRGLFWAVTAGRSGQGDIEDRFTRLLENISGPRGGSGARPGRASMLLGAGFGEGKSHLLTHLGLLATSAGLVVSTVVISKETPLHDPAKVLRAAMESAVAPDGARDVVAEAAAALDADGPGYAELLRWLRGPGRDLNERFDAILLLHQKLSGDAPGADEEFLDSIVRFWSGDPLRMPDLRRQLKAAGEAKSFTFSPIKARDLAWQRLRFLPRLLRAGGHVGWVILFDEVELIGRYSLLQRGRSYAELARWLDGNPGDEGEPLITVAAITDDFEAAVLSGKNDREILPGRLRNKQTQEYAEMAALAEAGMRHIERDLLRLVPPDQAELDRAYRTLSQLHGTPTGGSRRTSRASNTSAPCGCANTCGPGSMNGTSCVLTPATDPSRTWSTYPATTKSSPSWTTTAPDQHPPAGGHLNRH